MKRDSFFGPVFYCALVLATGRMHAQVNIKQYLSIRSATAPTLSPDGKFVAFRSAITGVPQIWRVGRQDRWPDQITFYQGGVQSATWSPKGDWILITFDQDGNEQFQMALVSPDGSKIIPLTNNPKVRYGFGGWSSDGNKICYASNAVNPEFFDCYVMDIVTKQETRVLGVHGSLSASALSRDGSKLAAVHSKSNFETEVYVVDLATNKSTNMTPRGEAARYNVVGFSADGSRLFMTTDAESDLVHLVSCDLSTGIVKPFVIEESEVESAVMAPSNHQIAYTVNRNGYADLQIVDTETGKKSKLPRLPAGLITPGDFTADSKFLALSINTPSKVSDVWLLDIQNSKLEQMTRSSTAGLDTAKFVEPQLIKWKSFDGLEVSGLLYEPRRSNTNASIPVILSVHGGPEAQERPQFSGLYQYFVARGYAVLAPNIRGSLGFGKKYLGMDNGPKRWDALKDLAAAVDFIGKRPGLDVNRVAIFGGSYGGFAVLAMMAHYPHLFAAGIDLFGVTDFKTFLANTSSYRRANRAAEYGDPVKDSAYMDAISPALHAANIKSPLLVIQGANDPRVPESESRQIVNKVKAAGGKVEYILFPDEGHGIAKLPNRMKAYPAIVDFLDRYLNNVQTKR